MKFTLSIRTYITAIVLASILPMLVFAGVLVNRAAINEQAARAQAMRDNSRAAAIDVNRRLDGLVALAMSIADARTLQEDDLPQFYRRWGHVVRREGLTASLYDISGRQILDTATPFGTALPPHPELIEGVVATGDIAISRPLPAARGDAPMINIYVPVRRKNELLYVLSLSIANAMRSVMGEQILLAHQIAQLTSRDGIVISVVPDDGRDGIIPLTEFSGQIGDREHGSFEMNSPEGVPTFVAFSRVQRADWVVAITMPSEIMLAPVRQSLYRLGALGGGTLLIAGGLAWGIGRGAARSISRLAGLAVSQGNGATNQTAPGTPIREVNAVVDAMQAAADALHQQIHQRERTEQQLIQAQKMEAIGQLTGGMAHDFNNLLAVIVGCLELLGERMDEGSVGQEFVAEALSAAARGSEMTRQLLVFARRQPLVPVKCDVNRIIDEFARLLRRTLGEDVVIDLRLADDLKPVMMDRVQFESTITNLANNARHAMPNGGHLTVTTRNTHLDEEYAATHLDVRAGDYVLIEMRDTGTGMTPEVMEKIFDPFFTTREPGTGTGLGLSMVFGFMKQSGGHINVYSEVGEGTTFRLYFPPAPESASSRPAAIAEAGPAPTGHGETILVVEDNTVLRRMLCRQLIGSGYRVLEADNGRAALDMIQRHEPFDLLLTDIVMPGGMNGRELARLAGLLRPELKVLLTSGFSDDTSGENAAFAMPHFLRKPYPKEELLRMVHESLHVQTV